MKTQDRKQNIREKMQRRRMELNPSEARRASEQIAGQLSALLEERFPLEEKTLQIAVYAAIRGELDLSAWYDTQTGKSCAIYFPAVYGRHLRFGRLPSGVFSADFLHPGVFGVPEPPPRSIMPQNPVFDLVLVPGLAFDRQGNRIGWGKGYYDRFLRTLSEKTVRIGVCYAFQLSEDPLPTTENDQTVNGILTPEAYFDCPTR